MFLIRSLERTPRQQPQTGSDGRHYRPSIGRMAKLQRVAEMGVDLSRSRHRGERRPPLDIGIMKQGLVRWAPVGERSAKRPHVMCVSRDRVAWKSGFAMRLFAQPLGEASVEVAHGRDVEAVQPDHGPIGLIAVVVPLPPWSEDQIERLHHSFFTIDRCESPAPLKHETQGALRVSMAWRDFRSEEDPSELPARM